MSSWTRQVILQLYRHQFPDRGDARIVTDNEAGTWTVCIYYDDELQEYFGYDMNSEQEALDNVLKMLRKDEDNDPDDSEDSNDSDYSDDSHDSEGSEGSEDEEEPEDEEESEDEEEPDEEQSDDEDLHDSDSEDPDDQGDRFYLSDDEEDFDSRNNHGNPYCWEESDDSYGFSNGVGQVGSYERCW
ncbi:hypothetical protein KCV07_g5219, partial [Aureobasidium melanogenum]